MSSNTPFEPSGQTEYLGSHTGSGAPAAAPTGRRWGGIGAAAAGVVGVVALGGWGAYAFLAGSGDQPAEVIPSTAVGYLSLDLDPSAEQKIEAFAILKKFPAIEKELDVSGQEDLRKLVFTQMQEDGSCEDLDYDQDIKPWIGDRVAVAGVPVGEDAAPLVVLQVTDEEAAEKGVETLAKCGEAGEDFGFVLLNGYVLISDSDKHATALASAAEEASLADDPAFQKWTDAVGDPGIVTMYASAEAPKLIFDQMGQGMMGEGMMGEGLTDGFSQEFGADPESETGPMGENFAKMYDGFEGGAGVIRFEGGAVEAEFAAKGMPGGLTSMGADDGTPITDLPASTALAISASLKDGWLEDSLSSMSEMSGEKGMSVEDMLKEAEAQSGLELPEDVETLLGDGFALAVDADVDFAKLMRAPDPAQVPVGIRVEGDPDKILPVVEKIKAKLGPPAEMLVVESGDGVVVFGANAEYAKLLVQEGSLGADATFQGVVPDADAAGSVLYVNFDAGDGWAASLADLTAEGESEARANVVPLDALGVTGWVDSDEVVHGLFRLTTD